MGIRDKIIGLAPGRRAQEPKSAEHKKQELPPHRVGRKNMGVWLDPVVIERIKLLAARTGKNQTELALEAYDDLFRKYGEPPIGKGDMP